MKAVEIHTRRNVSWKYALNFNNFYLKIAYYKKQKVDKKSFILIISLKLSHKIKDSDLAHLFGETL